MKEKSLPKTTAEGSDRVVEQVRVGVGEREALVEALRATHALRESEQKLRGIVEQSYDGIGLVDEQGTVVEWNQGMERITGLKQSDVLGQSMWDIQFRSAPEEHRNPDMYERLKHGTLEFLRTGQAIWANQLQEMNIQRPDGTRRNIQSLIFPIQTDSGFMAGHITRDVTEQRQAEAALQQAHDELERRVEKRTAELAAANKRLEQEIADRKRAEEGRRKALAEMFRAAHALRESKERYHAIFEQAADSIALVDIETGEIAEFNAKAHENLGYTREEFEKLQLSDFVVSEPAEQAMGRSEKIHRGGAYTFEVKQRTKSGELQDVLTSVRTISIGGRNYAQRIWHDITERKQAEEMLQRRNRELTLLNQTGYALSSFLDLDQVLVTVLDEVRHLLDAAACSIWLVDSETGELVCRQATGTQSDVVRGWRLALGEGLAGYAVRTGKSLIVPDAQADARYFKGVDQQTGLPLRSVLSVPLQVKERTIGALQVVDTAVNCFDIADLQLLEPLAASAAIAIENARLYKEADDLRAFNENIIQSMEEGIVLYDPEGHITFVNSRMAKLLGYPPEEVIGRSWRAFVPPEYRAEVEKEAAKRPQGIAGQYETAILNREGQRTPVIVSARPLFEDGQFAGTLSVFTDITERKQAEADIQRYNEELIALNRIATTLGQPIKLHQALSVTLDRVLEVAEADAGWIQLLDEEIDVLTLVAHRGFSPEALVEMETIELGKRAAGKDIQPEEPAVVDRFSYSSRISAEIAEREGSHTFAWVPIKSRDRILGVLNLFSSSPRQPSAQEMQLLTAIAHQIGAAIENAWLAEEASEIEILRGLDRLRSELVANVSHELRTPLGLIKFFVTSLLMEDADFDWETQSKFLHGIDEEADRLEVIVNNLLDISYVESGRLRLDRRPTNVSQLVKEIVASMNAEIEVQPVRHHLVYDFPSEPLVAPVDVRRIEQVLRNLLHNATKYSPDGSTITVQGRGDKEQVLIWVSDQGMGIPPQDLERVFERFYRIDNEITQTTRGAGLGLSVCQGIVEAHGGRIWAESVLGEGSTFYFTLPLTADETIGDLVSDREETDEER